jgi:hypothetical protein
VPDITGTAGTLDLTLPDTGILVTDALQPLLNNDAELAARIYAALPDNSKTNASAPSAYPTGYSRFANGNNGVGLFPEAGIIETHRYGTDPNLSYQECIASDGRTWRRHQNAGADTWGTWKYQGGDWPSYPTAPSIGTEAGTATYNGWDAPSGISTWLLSTGDEVTLFLRQGLLVAAGGRVNVGITNIPAGWVVSSVIWTAYNATSGIGYPISNYGSLGSAVVWGVPGSFTLNLHATVRLKKT